MPGLADIPLLGRLFSDQTNSHSKTELVLSITPHIVRSQPHLDAAESEAWVGTEMFQRLKPVGGRFDNEGQGLAGPQPPAGARRSPSAAGAASASLPGAKAVAAPDPIVVPAGAPAVINWAAPSTVKVGDVFDVQLQLRTGVSLGSLALSLQYPNAIFGLVGFSNSMDMPEAVAEGAPAVHAEPQGVGVIDVQRGVSSPNTVPMSLVRLQFKALKAGDAQLTVKSTPSDPIVSVGSPAPWTLKVEP